MPCDTITWRGIPLTVVSNGTAVTKLYRGTSQHGQPDAITAAAIAQLKDYFTGQRSRFDLPLAPEEVPEATPFRLAVWKELASLPYGQTVTYGQLAARLGRPGAARAVGGAVGANPLLVVVPCHRVVARDGIGGFSAGADLKRILLQHEGIL